MGKQEQPPWWISLHTELQDSPAESPYMCASSTSWPVNMTESMSIRLNIRIINIYGYPTNLPFERKQPVDDSWLGQIVGWHDRTAESCLVRRLPCKEIPQKVRQEEWTWAVVPWGLSIQSTDLQTDWSRVALEKHVKTELIKWPKGLPPTVLSLIFGYYHSLWQLKVSLPEDCFENIQ